MDAVVVEGAAMSQKIHERLNQIPERILSTEFLTGQGLGNEIGFWIFDYAPEDELKVREYLHFLDGMLEKKHSQLKVVNIYLLQAVVDYLAERNFIDKAIQMQKAKGDDALLKALKGLLEEHYKQRIKRSMEVSLWTR